ncbi:MAG: hypothetical protein F6K14_17120 [Symploca sp. SIO2C1]|nr:hypothetical protein [Symploca sp. SIO2C1]
MINSDKPEQDYHQDLDYWLGRQTECQQALNFIAGKNNESVWKLRGKLEAYSEIIAYCQRKLQT